MSYEDSKRLIKAGTWIVKCKGKIVAQCDNPRDAEIEAAYIIDSGNKAEIKQIK